MSTDIVRKHAIMVKWSLSGKNWDALDDLQFSTTDAAVFRNATISRVQRRPRMGLAAAGSISAFFALLG